MRARWWAAGALCGVGLAALTLTLATRAGLRAPPVELPPAGGSAERARIVDREGRPISVTFENPWNVHDAVPLHEVPELLRRAVIEAEDRRFFRHGGVDWLARLHAVVQNARAGRGVRGASTITEQAVRMIHPRPRSAWARWLEGFEAARLERRFTKGEILEFYLNQVPYARRRRGVAQAARDLFDRDLETLSAKETLVLAVLVRSPSRLDPRRSPTAAAGAIGRLASRMRSLGLLSEEDLWTLTEPLELRSPTLSVEAPHFVRYVRGLAGPGGGTASVRTTLDGSLQGRVEAVLAQRIRALASRGVSDGAVLVADHHSGEILAWVNAGGFSEREASQIDAVVTPRQPGSTLKPFVYALALERGWTAATLIDDTPLAAGVGTGLHRYRNYSRRHHGPIRLREALGSSLNVPAVRTVRHVGTGAFHGTLRDLGFRSLARHPEFYGEGLALGNGEVTLLELVGAYATLARGGAWRPLTVLRDDGRGTSARRVFAPEVSSLIADMLSDPEARALEFGRGGVLELPVQTAVKTGTSSDYRDAWAIGFSRRHTVGVWLGNLDRREMGGVTGSVGPAPVLRAVFAELRRDGESSPLHVSRGLRRAPVCRRTGLAATPGCPAVDEWFREGRAPAESCPRHAATLAGGSDRAPGPGAAARLVSPTPGLWLARDPRIPDDLETFCLEIEASAPALEVEWLVDGSRVGTTPAGEHRFAWRLAPGRHVAQARVHLTPHTPPIETRPVAFHVK